MAKSDEKKKRRRDDDAAAQPAAEPAPAKKKKKPRWRDQRARTVTAATGNLALVETRWSGATRPDVDAERAVAGPTVTVTELSRTSIDTPLRTRITRS